MGYSVIKIKELFEKSKGCGEEDAFWEEFAKALNKTVPTPVSERPPDIDDPVMGFTPKTGRWHECYYNPAPFDEEQPSSTHFVMADETKQGNAVTHWLEMPPKPE